MDDFISLAIPQCKQDLDHISSATIHGVHSVFPEDSDDEEDPIALKKLNKVDGAWAVRKEQQGWTFDGVEKTIKMEEAKVAALLNTLCSWSQVSSVPFSKFQKTVGTLQNATIRVPAARSLFSEFNKILGREPAALFFGNNTKTTENNT